MRRRPAVLAGALLLAAGLALTGCTGNSTAEGSSSSSGSDSGVPAPQGAEAGAPASAAGSAGGGAASGSNVVATRRQIITTASAQLRATDVDTAVAKISDLVAGVGGRVDDRSQDDPGGSKAKGGGTAHLTVRVPSDSLTQTLSKLDSIGSVAHVAVQTRDVTATAVDLDARISALQTSTARLQHLLDTAQTTADLVAAESALTDRQAQLESLQGQRTALAGQVELATLTLTVLARHAPVVAQPEGFTGGLAAGWHALVASFSAALVVIGAVLPWAVIAAIVVALGLAGRRGVRRLRRGRQVHVSS